MFTIAITRVLMLALMSFAPQEPCHFIVKVDVRGSGDQMTVRTSTPNPVKPNTPRPVLEVAAGEEITITWTVTALEKNTTALKDITIHSFLARETEPGQTRRPSLDETAVLETALFMDFSSSDSTRGTFDIVMDDPGSYLVQVETIGLAETEYHEHSAALEVKVVPADERRTESQREAEENR